MPCLTGECLQAHIVPGWGMPPGTSRSERVKKVFLGLIWGVMSHQKFQYVDIVGWSY